MADTGFKVSGAIVSAGTWSNFTTTRINTSDDSRATTTAVTGAATSTGVASTFGFGIPGAATIDGIEVTVEFSDGTAFLDSVNDVSLSWNAGSNFTAAKSNTVTGTTDTVRTYGGAADTWGHAFTDTELSDANFQLRVVGSTNGGTNRIDHIQVKVYYTSTNSPSSSASASLSPSASVSRSLSPSASASASLSPSSSASRSLSPSASSSPSSSVSASLSPSSSASPSQSPSASSSPSSSASQSVSPSASASASTSPSPSAAFQPTQSNVMAIRQTDSIAVVKQSAIDIQVID